MRKFYSLVLAMALMLVGGVAWADDITATLVHTASSSSQGTAGVFTNTVDAEAEHVNNTKFSGTWAGAAYAEFSLATLPAGEAITSAKLSFTGIGESRNARNTDVLYANAGESINYETMPTSTDGVNLAATSITSVSFPKASSQRFDVDVTDAVKAIVAAEQTYIIFKFTGNPGGGDLAGKGSENAPVLTITTANAASQTTYTVKFTDGTAELKEAAQYDGTIGNPATASEADMASFVDADGQKWIYESGNTEITLAATAAENVITLKFRKAATYSYEVKSSLGYPIGGGTSAEGESVTVPFPQYIEKDGTLYQAAAINKEYNYSFTLDEDEKVITIEYTATDITDVLFFTEAEDIEGDGVVADNSGNANIRCSMSEGAYFTSDVTLTTLSAGTYKVATQVWGNAGVTFTIKAGETTVLEAATVGWCNPYTSEEFTLTETTDIIIATAGSAGKVLDWVYITGTAAGEAEPEDVTDLIRNPAYLNKGVNAEADYAGWTYTENGWKPRNYDEPMNLITYSGNCEFEVSQTLENVPVGLYKLTVNAFYRAGSLDDEKAKVASGAELEKELAFYAETAAGTYADLVMNLSEDMADGQVEGTGTEFADGAYVPNSASDARTWYIAGKYTNELLFNVFEPGNVTIGLKKGVGLPSDYCPIGAWKLYRMGDADPDAATPVDDEEETYTITVAETEHGTVTVDPEEAAEGDEVTVTVDPEEGYMVDEAYYTYSILSDENPTGEPVQVDLEPNADGTSATFAMPAANVTVTILFKQIEEDVPYYEFVASEWPAGDPNRISGNDVSVDEEANTITVIKGGDNNVALIFRGKNYMVSGGDRYFVIKGTGLSAEAGKAYLWWLNNTNNGAQHAPTAIYEEEGATCFAWDIKLLPIGGDLAGEEDALFSDEGGWSTTFGLTMADGQVPAVISYIGFLPEIPEPVYEEEYTFIASEWVAGDPGRISADNVVVDEEANTITVNKTGDNNVNLNFQSERITYVEGAKYFIITGTGLSAEEGKAYLWWLNATNGGSQVPPTNIVRGEDGELTFVWEIATTGIGKTFEGERTYLNGTSTWTTCFGLTLADAETPAVITDINFTAENVPDAIGGIRHNGTKANGKYLENNTIVIYKDGKKFSVMGVEMK